MLLFTLQRMIVCLIGMIGGWINEGSEKSGICFIILGKNLKLIYCVCCEEEQTKPENKLHTEKM